MCSVGVRTFPQLRLPRAGGFGAAVADGDRCWWDDGAGRSRCLCDSPGAGLAGSKRNPPSPLPGYPRVPQTHAARTSHPRKETVLGWAPGELLLNFMEREAPGAPGEPSAAPAERRWQPRLRGSGHGAYQSGSAPCPHTRASPGLPAAGSPPGQTLSPPRAGQEQVGHGCDQLDAVRPMVPGRFLCALMADSPVSHP